MAGENLELERELLEQQQPPLSAELDERESLMQQLVGEANLQEDSVKAALQALYGDEFPLLEPEPDNDSWARWAKALWDKHEAGVRTRLHLVQRNRLFRLGVQWISSQGTGPWKEPPKPRDAARVVHNMVAPALDQRVQIVAEQRPGPQVHPISNDMDDIKRAEVQKIAIEYQMDQQQIQDRVREAEYWAGTDGVCFWELYWDPERGPWDEQKPMGDVNIRLRRIENVRVSADATAAKEPWYWVVQEVIPKAQAVREYGPEVVKDMEEDGGETSADISLSPGFALYKNGFLLPSEDELLRDQKTVSRVTVYCKPSEYLPQGLTLITVGRKVILGPQPLLFGRVPMVRFSDGSTDPSFFSRPIMDDWIDPQMRVNAVLSKWVENVRLNAGPRLIAQENSIVGETLVGSTATVMNVRSMRPVGDAVHTLDGMSLAADAKELFALEKKAFEDISGWNDVSRGSFSSEQSGRAILAIRENLERVFAPVVTAAARALCEWSKITLAIMRWGYDQPRTLGMAGKGRPDLARTFSQPDFDGVGDVQIDPETMIPMPRALRLFLLDDLFSKQLLSPQEYRRRVPFAFVGNLQTPDVDQEARARRVCEALRQGQQLPILWQDDEAIHQDILQRELILPDDLDPQVRQLAAQRWMMLAQQSMMKMGVTPPGAPSGPSGGGSSGGGPNSYAGAAGMTPSSQPLIGSGGGPSMTTNPTQQGAAATQFDRTSQR